MHKTRDTSSPSQITTPTECTRQGTRHLPVKSRHQQNAQDKGHVISQSNPHTDRIHKRHMNSQSNHDTNRMYKIRDTSSPSQITIPTECTRQGTRHLPVKSRYQQNAQDKGHVISQSNHDTNRMHKIRDMSSPSQITIPTECIRQGTRHLPVKS